MLRLEWVWVLSVELREIGRVDLNGCRRSDEIVNFVDGQMHR